MPPEISEEERKGAGLADGRFEAAGDPESRLIPRTVLRGDGSPAPKALAASGAKLKAERLDLEDNWARSTEIGVTGRFELRDLSPGEFRIWVDHPFPGQRGSGGPGGRR